MLFSFMKHMIALLGPAKDEEKEGEWEMDWKGGRTGCGQRRTAVMGRDHRWGSSHWAASKTQGRRRCQRE